jgi:uncharacterized protein YcbK (DUF882 family)
MILSDTIEQNLRGKVYGWSYFTWSEVTHGFTRPITLYQVEQVKLLVKKLHPYRERVGHPFVVTSWLRTVEGNRKSGGSATSFHLQGAAVDFYCPKLSANNLGVIFHDWSGGLGIYLSWIHCDIGPYRRWRK